LINNKNKKDMVRIVQVTDMHLFANTSDVLVGMNCEAGLQDVLATIKEDQQNDPLAIQAILCTGDISQDNSADSYRRLEAALNTFQAPYFWIPGNHDELARMEAALGADHPCFSRSVVLPGWRIIMLNSSVKGEVSGLLSAQELEVLQTELANNHEPHVMVCLHHNPVPVASHWLQQHALKNPQALFDVLDKHPEVQVVLFGHIHQALDQLRNDVRYLGSPSTCIQFHPDSFDFALDSVNPGYRWFNLHADGTVETGVSRVRNKKYAVDFSGIGY